MENNMYNIYTIKRRIQSFLLPAFILTLFASTAITFASNFPSMRDKTAPDNETVADISKKENSYAEKMEIAINDYKKISENGGWPAFESGKTIKPGEKDDRVPAVRAILAIMGDYKASGKSDEKTDGKLFDEALVEAVKKFQVRHGLEADGALGKKTQGALSIPVDLRIAQMQASLERMRAMPELGNRYVLVNIPGYYLKAVDDNNTVINSRIIVGTPQNATPLFNRPITAVSFNPAWHVPPKIARNEFIGKIRENPDYLYEGNYIIKNRHGEIVDADEIDWEKESGHGYKFIQLAGEKNALGKVKFNLPDTDNIYLHSTGSPKLFAKSERALSHGCIRVEMARELAHFVMEGMNGWDEERISELYDSDKTKTIKVTPVDVYITYWTSWVDEDSKRPHFSADIYSRDKKRVAEIWDELSKAKDETNIAMQ
jgi:murein L,D-transpeptidase YcbB/YkuD